MKADFQAICFILWERYFKGRKMFLMFLQNPLNDFIKWSQSFFCTVVLHREHRQPGMEKGAVSGCPDHSSFCQ